MHVGDGLALGLLAVLVACALGFWRGRRRRSALEHQGEGAVRRALTHQCPGPTSPRLPHLTLSCQDGTTHMDHGLVATRGIVVIASKPDNGTMIANPAASTWTKIIGPYAYRFQHPGTGEGKRPGALGQRHDGRAVAPAALRPRTVRVRRQRPRRTPGAG